MLELPWISKEGIGGAKDFDVYYTQSFTYLLSMMDRKSPIRVQHAATNKLGGPWTNKHGQLPYSHPMLSILLNCVHLQDAKGLNAIVLIRSRLAWANSPAVARAAKLNEAFGIYLSDTLKRWYRTIRTHLQDDNMGPFNLLCLMFGEERAYAIAASGQCPSPVRILYVPTIQTSPRKRRNPDSGFDSPDSEDTSRVIRRR